MEKNKYLDEFVKKKNYGIRLRLKCEKITAMEINERQQKKYLSQSIYP
jgi:hypothetical protein